MRVVRVLEFLDDAIVLHYVDDVRDDGVVVSQQLLVPETPALADVIDELRLFTEELIEDVLEGRFSEGATDDAAEDDEVSPWDNPLERELPS